MDAVQRHVNLDLATQSLLRIAQAVETVKKTRKYQFLDDQIIELMDTIELLREIRSSQPQE